MRRLRRLFWILLLLLAAPLSAQDQVESSKRFSMELEVSAQYYDNFFQSSVNSREEKVDATFSQVRLSWSFGENRQVETFAAADSTSWDRFDDTTGLAFGLLRDGERHRYSLEAGLQRDRPIVDVGDELDTAATDRLRGRYSYLIPGAWEVSVIADLVRQSYRLRPQNDNDQYSVGAALRYRGFGYVFSPEIGVMTGERDALAPNEDVDQDVLYLQLRFVPSPSTYLSLRYRDRSRDYVVGLPTASNFGRLDDRSDLTVSLDVKLWRNVSADLYYVYEDADSTKPSRAFTTQMLFVGLGVEF